MLLLLIEVVELILLIPEKLYLGLLTSITVKDVLLIDLFLNLFLFNKLTFNFCGFFSLIVFTVILLLLISKSFTSFHYLFLFYHQ